MARRLPGWIDTPPASDVSRSSPNERLELFVQACNLSTEILRGRADAREVLARRVPLSPESERLWLRLVAEGRRAREAR